MPSAANEIMGVIRIRNQSVLGFTLLEILVVIAMIALLSSIVLAATNSGRTRSRDAKRIADMDQIKIALLLYSEGDGAGQYPPASAIVAANCDLTTKKFYGLELLLPKYMPVISTDPTKTGMGKCYRYATPASPMTTYHIGVILEDGANQILANDVDFNSAGFTNAFDGKSKADANGHCGTALGAGEKDRCYDVRP